MITIHELEPFTYYRSGNRGFLLVDLPTKDFKDIVLLEFGRPRSQPVRYDVEEFLNLVNQNKLQKFIPKTN